MTLSKCNSLAIAVAFLVVFVFSPSVFAQGPMPDAPVPSNALVEPVIIQPRVAETRHKFWDRENQVLFLTTAALSGADFVITRSNLQGGGRELNPVVRVFGTSTPGLAVNFIGETACVMSLSYFFHRTGHHKLERAVTMVNIGASAGAVTYGLAHRAQ